MAERMVIKELFREQVKRTPNHTAIIYREKETTFLELDSLSNRFANGILSLGIKKGERVAGIISNSLEFVVTYLALLKCGVVFVPLNFQSKASHIRYTVNHSESRAIVCDNQFFPLVKDVMPSLNTVQHVIVIGWEGGGGIHGFDEVIAMGEEGEVDSVIDEEDIAVFLYTAGTTGDPKGVVHTHFNCSFVSRHWSKVFHMEPGKTILMPLPLFHAFGLHCITLPSLISGSRLLIAERYQTQWVMEAIQKYRVTALPLVPAMGTLIINHEDFSKYDFSSLEIMLIGGAMVPYELLKQWRKAFPKLEIINGYGQTESCPCATGLWDVDILEKPGSVGKPWKAVQLKIVDNEGRELPFRQVGEIVYKVPSIMKEYYKDPALTAETVRDGWLYSGDLGYMDEDGYVYIVDRKKDIIIRGGENISSIEVEEVLHKHPAVLEASAIGAPHPILGETVMAVVVRKPGFQLSEDELIEFCKGYLEPFKVPARVEFIDELPRNPGGKVLKRELKKRYFPD